MLRWCCNLVVAFALAASTAANGDNVVRGTVQLRDSAGLPIARRNDVVVFLDGGPRTQVRVAATRTPVISQRGRQFTPRVVPVVVGTTIQFLNDDDIYHNVFSLARVQPFDLGIYPKNSTRSLRFDRPGLVPLHCNIHPNMVGYLLVLANPHFALTDAAGRYEIAGVPDGQYSLRTWDELAPEYRRTVELARSTTTTIDIALQRTRVLAPHVDKFGRRYREKY